MMSELDVMPFCFGVLSMFVLYLTIVLFTQRKRARSSSPKSVEYISTSSTSKCGKYGFVGRRINWDKVDQNENT